MNESAHNTYECWHLIKVALLAKIPDWHHVKHFRPITLLPCLQQILDLILARRITRALHLQLAMVPEVDNIHDQGCVA